MKLCLHIERWQASAPLRITGRVFEFFECVVVELQEGITLGRGEALGIFYKGETAETMAQQIESIRPVIEAGIDRTRLQDMLPLGGARHAIDQALWDLEAKTSGRSIWQMTGIEPRSIQSGMTIGIEATPEQMAARARELTSYTTLKVKLDEHQPVERVTAIRQARPDATIHVDANQGWTLGQLKEVAPLLADMNVRMIEQPLPRGGDAELATYRSPVPLCADESCFDLDDLDEVSRRYQMINIKLDKTGGLTHALQLAKAARERGLALMVGCMGGTSLAMAPAFVLGCIADLVDIDGPPWLRNDRGHGMHYGGAILEPFGPELWG